MNKIFTLTILTLVLITGTIFTVNYPNISNNIIDENLGTTPPLQPTQGGTGTSTAPTFGQLLVGNASGKYTLTSTSSLGISGSGTVTSVDMSVPTGLTISGNPITTSGTLSLTLTGGYEIPTTASTSDWSNNVSSQWVTSGSNIYYSTGYVGIGSTSPYYMLDVAGNIGSSGDIYADNINYNEGMLNEPTIADADGVNISITEGEALLRSDSTWDGDKKLYYKTITATTSLAVFDNGINYIYAYWNSGTPIYGTTQDRDVLNNSNYVPVARVYMMSGNIEYQMSYQYLGRSSSIRNFDRVMRIRGSAGIEKESGLSISETATRVINLTAGYAWFGMSRKQIDALVQNATNTNIWYHSGGNWTSSATTTYNNTYYDNGTNIVALTSNRYAVNWVYRNLQTAEIDIVMGTGDYTLAQAEASTVPTPPTAVSNFYVLTGRIIVQKAASTATAIENVSTTAFQQSAVSSHSDLSNLNWASAGHTFDTAFSTGAYNILTSGTVLATSTQFINASTTNLTVSTNSYLGTIVSGTWNGTKIDISDYTNLTITATGLELSSDAIALTTGYNIPLTASTTNWNTAYNWGNHASAGYLNQAYASTTYLKTGGTLTTNYHCRYDGTGIDCDRLEDASGACAANSVCMGGHTHVGADEVYGSGWNNDTSTPEKDDVYDWGHLLDTDDDGSANNLDTDAVDTITEIAAALKDGSGDCSSGLLCLGDHTHSAYTLSANASTTLLSASGASWFDGISTFVSGVFTKIKIAISATLYTNTGEIGIDTTSGQLRYSDGTATSTLSGIFPRCFTIASSTPLISGNVITVGAMPYGITVVSHSALVDDGTTQVIGITDGTNDMTTLTASTTRNVMVPSSNNTFTSGENIKAKLGTNTGNVHKVNYCINYRIDAD